VTEFFLPAVTGNTSAPSWPPLGGPCPVRPAAHAFGRVLRCACGGAYQERESVTHVT
jgi:hypothetical protein